MRAKKATAAIPSRGFTLMELLTAIAVAALLAAVLLCAVGKSAGMARWVKCEDNLRQIGLGMAEFAGDFGAYPLGVNRRGYSLGIYREFGLDWYDALNRNAFHLPPLQARGDGTVLVPIEGVWHCPAARRPDAWAADPIWKNVLWVEYGYNEFGVGGHASANLGLGRVETAAAGRGVNYKPTPEKDVLEPSDMIEAGDGILGWGASYLDGSDDIGVAARAGWPQRFNDTGRARQRHEGRVNMVFCDGHTAGLEASALFSLTNSAALARWNKDHQPHREWLY